MFDDDSLSTSSFDTNSLLFDSGGDGPGGLSEGAITDITNITDITTLISIAILLPYVLMRIS